MALVSFASAIAPWFIDVLLLATAALAAYADGVIGALIVLAATPFVLAQDGDLNRHHAFGESIEILIVVIVAIVARRKIARLREAGSKLRALLFSMKDVILLLDHTGKYLEIVPTNPDLLYRPADELIGRRISEFFSPAQTEFFLSQIARVLEERKMINVDYSLQIGDHLLWFTAAVSPLDETRVLWVARDISEHKTTEAKLEERVKARTIQLSRTVGVLEEEINGRVASEERYRSVFEQARDVIFMLSNDGSIVSLNPAFKEILGWSCADWIGRPFAELIADDDLSIDTLLTLARRNGCTSVSRMIATSKQGARVVLELTLAEQVIQEKRVGFLGIARDVTDRESAESDLRRKERQQAEAQRLGHIGSFEHDLITGTLWCSDEMYRIFGLEPSAMPMDLERFLQFLPPDERPRFDQAVAVVVAQGENEWEFRANTPLGEKSLSCKGRLLSDDADMRLVVMVQDVTEKKHAEQMLRDSEERFRLLAQATSDAVYDLDVTTGKVWRGDGYETFFGYQQGELRGEVSACLDLVHPDERERIHAATSQALETGEPSWSEEYRFRRADGSYAHILDRAYIVRNAQKQPIRVLGAMMDISERKQLEQEVEQAKRVTSLGRMAASIAHEVNNVLMGIQPNVEVIARKGPAELKHVTENIMQAVRRGGRVTEEILRFTRPAEPSLQCVAVGKCLDRWSEEIRPLLGTSIDLEIETDTDLYMLADPLQIGQVLTNLALNARDAMQERAGKLSIRVELARSFDSFRFGVVKSPDRFVHFSVRDEGSGITKDRLAHVFEPLFTTKKGGVGLGLAISYQVVTRHKGHIFVESEVGVGTTFHVFLPATSPIFHETEVAKSPEIAIGRLLLVEDEPLVASGIAALLELEGVQVEIVATGGQALAAIERFSPDAVVLDIGLPDIDGVTIYHDIHRRWPELPVLFSSGHGDSTKLETLLERPNLGFILKPYDFDAFRAVLSAISAPVAIAELVAPA
ncbi:MAG TPA: PAS domain S-box protein [Thermoanaerobaculia bacterium]|nr:PAS domain S-box protein [Thermoanaerobaculia bacterium]